MNSEFGIIYIPLVCNKNRRADSISDRSHIVVLYLQKTVGDGSPVPRRKAFHNKKEPVFKDFEFFENRFFLFTKDNICAKNRFAIRDGKPVPYGKSVFAINLRSKIIPNSEFRIPNLTTRITHC